MQPPEPPKKPNTLEVCGAGSRGPGAPTCHHETPTGYGESLTHGKGGFSTSKAFKDSSCVKRMLLGACGAGSRETGAATCHPDAHRVGRQEPDR